MANAQVQAFMNQQDFRPPPRTPGMIVRYTQRWICGRWSVVMESSANRVNEPGGRIAGSVRLKLYDRWEPDAPPQVKRLQVDTWEEADLQMRELRYALVGGA